VGAAVVSSQAVSEPLKQAEQEQEQEEQEGATGPTKRAASQPATSPLPARPAQGRECSLAAQVARGTTTAQRRSMLT